MVADPPAADSAAVVAAGSKESGNANREIGVPGVQERTELQKPTMHDVKAYQPTFSANWISLPGVVVLVI